MATVNNASVNNNKFTGPLKNTSKPQNSTNSTKIKSDEKSIDVGVLLGKSNKTRKE